MTSRSRAALGAVTAVLTILLSACGSSSSPTQNTRTSDEPGVQATPTAQVTGTPPANAKTLAITITADSVDPDAGQLEISVNQPLVLQIHAVAAGELHVHSTPEQHIEFPAGDSQVTLTFDKKGLIDVEDHTLDKLIVQLEVN